MLYADIDQAVNRFGLRCRGAFRLSDKDGLGATGTLVLIGNVGTEMWKPFMQAFQDPAVMDADHPMDHWTRTVIDRIASGFKARAVYPFDGPPYHPFQQWAMRTDCVFPSPIGPLVHTEFGLWHAYRAALILDGAFDLPGPQEQQSPCESCIDKPCLTTCPADALAEGHYDVPRCIRHLEKATLGACRTAGCLARHACPVGKAYAQLPSQAQFHMDKFVKSQRPSKPAPT